jgi:ribosomal protein S18 acetylase RimI-like enzyme
MTHLVRFATPADADALVELRAAMFDGLRSSTVGRDTVGPQWRAAARAWFQERLAGGDVLVTVADPPGFGVVCCAMAVLEHRAPSPTNATGLAAHLSSVSTLPEHRRRGHARACVTALLAALDERGVNRTDLFASEDGEALSLDLGFRASPYPALRRP